jgi:2-methylcitrate dehydratase PrpD
VCITLKDGRTLQRREPTSRGTPERRLAPGDIEAKFLQNATRAVPERDAKRIADMVWELERLPAIGALVRECVHRG